MHPIPSQIRFVSGCTNRGQSQGFAPVGFAGGFGARQSVRDWFSSAYVRVVRCEYGRYTSWPVRCRTENGVTAKVSSGIWN